MSEKYLESKSSSTKSDASAALLADAQTFRLELNHFGTEQKPGSPSNDEFLMESPAFINAKLNQVNAMSQKDRETWLNDFKMANANDKMTGNPTDFANNYAPVYLNIQTGSDGKATNFEITTGNYDGIVNSTNHSMQSSAGVLDGSVGSSAPLNVHFNMNKTDSQFFTNEINGFNSLYGQDSA
jgi:hypothetical protein